MGMEHYQHMKDLGGTSGAFLAVDKSNPDKLVVIKQLESGMQGMAELQVSLRVQHPNIIQFLESFVYDGELYVVLKYERGGDLENFLAELDKKKRLPTDETILRWTQQLLEAVRYCHEKHIMHRDIKPGNIFLSEDTKRVFLGDFGSAKAMVPAGDAFTSTFVGSPLWISPEVLQGQPYSYPTDMWSLGCVIYEMACLQKPFSSANFAKLVHQITGGEVQALPASVSPVVRQLVHACLQLDPAKRLTAAAALETVNAAIAALPDDPKKVKPQKLPRESPPDRDRQPPAPANGSARRGGGVSADVDSGAAAAGAGLKKEPGKPPLTPARNAPPSTSGAVPPPSSSSSPKDMKASGARITSKPPQSHQHPPSGDRRAGAADPTTPNTQQQADRFQRNPSSRNGGVPPSSSAAANDVALGEGGGRAGRHPISSSGGGGSNAHRPAAVVATPKSGASPTSRTGAEDHHKVGGRPVRTMMEKEKVDSGGGGVNPSLLQRERGQGSSARGGPSSSSAQQPQQHRPASGVRAPLTHEAPSTIRIGAPDPVKQQGKPQPGEGYRPPSGLKKRPIPTKEAGPSQKNNNHNGNPPHGDPQPSAPLDLHISPVSRDTEENHKNNNKKMPAGHLPPKGGNGSGNGGDNGSSGASSPYPPPDHLPRRAQQQQQQQQQPPSSIAIPPRVSALPSGGGGGRVISGGPSAGVSPPVAGSRRLVPLANPPMPKSQPESISSSTANEPRKPRSSPSSTRLCSDHDAADRCSQTVNGTLIGDGGGAFQRCLSADLPDPKGSPLPRQSQWMRARNEDLSDIEHYLHKFRDRDDAVLRQAIVGDPHPPSTGMAHPTNHVRPQGEPLAAVPSMDIAAHHQRKNPPASSSSASPSPWVAQDNAEPVLAQEFPPPPPPSAPDQGAVKKKGPRQKRPNAGAGGGGGGSPAKPPIKTKEEIKFGAINPTPLYEHRRKMKVAQAAAAAAAMANIQNAPANKQYQPQVDPEVAERARHHLRSHNPHQISHAKPTRVLTEEERCQLERERQKAQEQRDREREEMRIKIREARLAAQKAKGADIKVEIVLPDANR